MHDLIREVLADREATNFAMFDYDEAGQVIDRAAYDHYIPDLIRCLNGKRGSNIYKADVLLFEIMPDAPEAVTVNALIEKMAFREHQVVLSKILSRIKMPGGVNFRPLFDLFKDEANYVNELVRALKHVAVPETEERVLAELRKGVMRYPEAIQVFADTLAFRGTIRSIPVLVAVSLDYPGQDVQQYFTDTLQAICKREGIPKSFQKQLIDPASWRIKWDGAPELFAGFVEFIAMFMISGPEGQDMTCQVGEIFLKEMTVDISPYKSFEALRLCSSPDHMMEGMANLKDSLENKSLLEALMEDTGIVPSSETMVQEMYFELMNDYLMTRLRRHFSFPEDHGE